MMENLRLESANSTNSSLAQGYGGNFVGLAEPEGKTNFDTVNSNSLYSITNVSYVESERFPRYNNSNTLLGNNNLIMVPTEQEGNQSGADYQWYSYGNYYTWPAAAATTAYQNSGSTSTSICPKGWSLPTGGTSSQVSAIETAVGGRSQLTNYPNNYVRSGRYGKNGMSDNGSVGSYWASTTTYVSTINCGGASERERTRSIDEEIGIPQLPNFGLCGNVSYAQFVST